MPIIKQFQNVGNFLCLPYKIKKNVFEPSDKLLYYVNKRKRLTYEQKQNQIVRRSSCCRADTDNGFCRRLVCERRYVN